MKTGAERLVMDPIEPMVASGSKTLGVLPRYKWASDGKTILIMQGGKLRRLDVATREVATIPFTAKVHRTISQMDAKSSASRRSGRGQVLPLADGDGGRRHDRVPGGGTHLGRRTARAARRVG